ncbi:PA14 domain-containing protein [uncultured Roseovarius sp.]|uniref:PA14 domain-containing protein n=1 Tax=uncultured Roseovarius sp. TaxID=293344 RepID=UPI002601EACB|nr:PA14 domain-containing protein [uncultured Roseovarius sp.]
MEDESFDDVAGEGFQPEADDLKKKAVEQSAKASGLTPEDQSRGVLHYGETHEGNASSSSSSNAEFAQSDNVSPVADNDDLNDQISSADGARPPQPGLTGEKSELAQPSDPQRSDENEAETNAEAKLQPTQSVQSNTSNAETTINDSEINSDQDIRARQPVETPEPAFDTLVNQPTAPEGADQDEQNNPVAEYELPDSDDALKTSENGTVADTNEAPSQISLSNQGLAENVEGAVVGTLSVKDQDIDDSHSFTISDERFEIADGQVKLKDGLSLDHEETKGLTLEVEATDSGGITFTQSFEISVADINEAPTQLSLSNHAIAEGADGAVVGTLSVADQDIGDSHSFTISDERFEIADGQVKLKESLSLDHDDAEGLTLEVEATDSGGNTFSQSFEVSVTDVPDVTLGTGFHAKYFDMNQTIRAIDDVDWNGTVTHQELVDDINYTNSSKSFWDGGSRDTFGVQITGNIEVEEGGVFNFHIGGDDGVVLFIDGKEVVDNDGLHGFRTRSGEVELEPGAHVIEVRYFENYGHAGLKVEWEGPGIDGRELLSPPDVGNLQTVNGMPITLDLETDVSQPVDGDFSQVIEGLPPGTMLQAGEMIAEVDDGGIADISGWDTSMLMVTPPVDFTGKVDAQVSTKVTLESGDTAVTTTELTFNVDQADVTPMPIEMQAGFRASYFDVDHSLDRLDQIDWDADPTKEEVIGEINYANGRESFWEGGSKDTFGVRITGEITVDEAGDFDFFLGGDDGVVLYIDGVEVIDNDRLHSYRTRSGEIELEAGTHEIEIRYFENYGHAGLKLEWEGPGTDGRELVHADTDLSVPENGTIEIQLNNAEIGPSGSVSVSGLPADTILVSGDHSLVSDGEEVDLTGWDLDMIELMPPPEYEGVISAEVTVSDTAFNGEETQTTNTFEIEVGDADRQPQLGDGHEDLLMSGDGTAEGGDPGWVEGSTAADGENEDGSEDNVMDEPVEDSNSAEQSNEMTETYERSDW